MAGPRFEPPPQVGRQTDDQGQVILTQEEWSEILSYLDRLVKFISDNYD